MYNDDYIMLFDENGQPYIEHASLAGIRSAVTGAVRSGVSKLKGMRRPGAKYYARIDDPKRPGDYLYFYSKEEYDRYRENQTRSRTADRELQRLERAVKANPSAKNKAALLSKREEINNAKRQAEESENAARKRSNEVSVGRAIDDAKSNLKSAKSSLGNKVNQAKNTIDQMKNDLKKKAGVGAKAAYDKEQKEADEANARYDRILQGYRDARARGDKESEERLGRTLRLYDETRSREEREAREAKNAYDDTWAGKANNMINRARKSISAGQDKVEDTIKSIKDGSVNLKNMSVSQINKMADDLKSAPAQAREYIDSGREAIQNTTGIGLRDTVNTLKQKLSDASQVRDKILAEHSAAIDAGDTERAAGLQRAFKRIDDAVSEYKDQVDEATKNYTNSIAGRRLNQPEPKSIPLHDTSTASDTPQVSDTRVRKLLDKFNDGATLTKKEMQELMSVLGGIFNS